MKPRRDEEHAAKHAKLESVLALQSGHNSQARRKRFADDTDAMDERGSNAGFIEKIRALRPIRAALSAVLQMRSSGFQKVSRLQVLVLLRGLPSLSSFLPGELSFS